MKKQTNPHRGSDFNDLLKEEGIFEEVSAKAGMRIIVEQIRIEMLRQKITEAQLAKRMETSRSRVHRLFTTEQKSAKLLTTEQKSANFETLVRIADALGKRWKVQLVRA